MKKTYHKPESDIIRLGLSSPIADEGPIFTTSRTAKPEEAEAKRGRFYLDEHAELGSSYGGWNLPHKSLWE